jgi:hypothetical protein
MPDSLPRMIRSAWRSSSWNRPTGSVGCMAVPIMRGCHGSQLPARSTVMPRLILDGVLRLEDRSYDELLGMLVR